MYFVGYFVDLPKPLDVLLAQLVGRVKSYTHYEKETLERIASIHTGLSHSDLDIPAAKSYGSRCHG